MAKKKTDDESALETAAKKIGEAAGKVAATGSETFHSEKGKDRQAGKEKQKPPASKGKKGQAESCRETGRLGPGFR
jgi:hypothetical protein